MHVCCFVLHTPQLGVQWSSKSLDTACPSHVLKSESQMAVPFHANLSSSVVAAHHRCYFQLECSLHHCYCEYSTKLWPQLLISWFSSTILLSISLPFCRFHRSAINQCCLKKIHSLGSCTILVFYFIGSSELNQNEFLSYPNLPFTCIRINLHTRYAPAV